MRCAYSSAQPERWSRVVMDEPDDLGYVVSLTFEAASPEDAAHRARLYARLLHLSVTGIEPESTTLAVEGSRSRMANVFCGWRINRDQRCMQAAGHKSDHSPNWAVL